MPRPAKCRTIGCHNLRHSCFKPHGTRLRVNEAIALRMDEVEAIRLADMEGLYQTEAALCMGISRQTFGTILLSARHKLACALIEGKPILLGMPKELAIPTPVLYDTNISS